MTNNLQFAAFVVEAERVNKISITSALVLPIKRLSSYYLVFQVSKLVFFYVLREKKRSCNSILLNNMWIMINCKL